MGSLNEEDLAFKNNESMQIMNTIVGRNLVPAYPFFLLAILQALETSMAHNLKESSYAYYYDILITKSLDQVKIRNEEIGAYYNYMAELANYFFENKTHELSQDKIETFNEGYYAESGDVDPKKERYVDKLINASILDLVYDSIRFKYKYIYYYFVAKYFATHITRDDIRERISKMTKRLYKEEFANIIMFLSHLSSDPFVLNEVVENGRGIFSGKMPTRFEEDINPINDLIMEIPKFVFKNMSVKEEREKKLRGEDKIEDPAEMEQSDNEFDLEEEIDNGNPIYKLNLAFKSIEVMGQILKNHYGTLKIGPKMLLGEEALKIGLRALNSIFEYIIQNNQKIVEIIESILKKEKIIDHLEIETESRRILFVLCFLFSYGFIEKISSSVGSVHLSETFKRVLEKNDTMAFHLIDISTKLNFFKAFPYNDIEELLKVIKRKNLPYALLRRMVLDYLYMFPVKYQDQQRICSKLGIPMEAQRIIDRFSTQKQRK